MANPFTASAPRLRLVLSITLLLLLGVGGGIIFFGLDYLNNYAQQVNKTVADAGNSSNRIDQIRQDIIEYNQDSEAVQLAKQVVAKRSSYQYQDDVYTDLLTIAAKAGVSIQKYSFSDTNPALGSATASSKSTKTTSSSQSSTSGLKPSYITITLANPVNYVQFLNFIHYIEQNLMKMQIAKISLSSAFGSSIDNAVNTDELTIEVWTQ